MFTSEMNKLWTIASARRHFSELVDAAATEAQPVYRRDDLVAYVVDPTTFAEFERWRHERTPRTVAEAFAELRQICMEEEFEFPETERWDRPNPFADEP